MVLTKAEEGKEIVKKIECQGIHSSLHTLKLLLGEVKQNDHYIVAKDQRVSCDTKTRMGWCPN